MHGMNTYVMRGYTVHVQCDVCRGSGIRIVPLAPSADSVQPCQICRGSGLLTPAVQK
jgi:hypothetical protein